MTDPEQKQLDAIVEKFLTDASEFSDSVRIFVSRYKGGGCETSALTNGKGNIYSQLAQVREWVIRKDEITRRNTV